MEGNEHMEHMKEFFLRRCESDQSVVIGPERYRKIVDVLLGVKAPTPSFKFWLKKNDFQLIDIPSTNETNVLVAPGKNNSDSHEKRYVRVLKLEDVYPAVSNIHMNEQNHGGSKKCFEAASKLFYRLPRSYIEEFVRTCPTCFHRKKRIDPIYVNMITEKNNRKGIFDKIKVNTINIGSVSTAGYTHVGMVEEQHSKFIVLFPLKTNTPADVAKSFSHHYLAIFGPPKSFISDNGQQFMDQVLHELLHTWNGIPLTLMNETLPNIPPEDVSDRCNIILDTLTNLISEKGENSCAWHDWLPDIALRLNMTQNEFRRSPFSIMFGHNAYVGEYNSNVIIKAIDDQTENESVPINNEQQNDFDLNHKHLADMSYATSFVLDQSSCNSVTSSDSLLTSACLEKRTSKRKHEQDTNNKLQEESPSKKLVQSLLPVMRNLRKKKKKKKKKKQPKAMTLAGCTDRVVVKATTSTAMKALEMSKLGIIEAASPDVRRAKSKINKDTEPESDQSSSSSEESSSEEEQDVISLLSKEIGEKTKMDILKTVMTSLAVVQKKKRKKKKART